MPQPNSHERRPNVDEQPRTNTGEQQTNTGEQPRTDGGPVVCVWCGVKSRIEPVGELPQPKNPETPATVCLPCWTDRMADASPLTEPEALVLGGEALGLGETTISQHAARPRRRVRDLRTSAVDKLSSWDAGSDTARDVVSNLDIPLPPATITE